jgi:hypothetical protein
VGEPVEVYRGCQIAAKRCGLEGGYGAKITRGCLAIEPFIIYLGKGAKSRALTEARAFVDRTFIHTPERGGPWLSP